MKKIKYMLTGAGLIFFLAVLPKTASARVSFHIGFGTDFGHYKSGFGIGCHPYFGFHGGYYRWLGRGHKVFDYRHFSRHKPWHSSGVSVWLGGLFPIVVRPPVVVKNPQVITERHIVIEKPERRSKLEDDKDTVKLFEKLRNRKSELLKILRIGDKANRIETIRELSGFSFDNKVREALEEVLLSDPDPGMRLQVAKSFGKTSNKKVIPALETAKADDPNPVVRQEAHNAIEKIEGHK